jgi:hypothetical protein
MNAIRRTLTLTAASALAVMLGACGGSDGPTTPVTTTPPAPTPRPPVVLDRGEGQLPALFALLRPLATTETGAFDVTVDWTFATNDIDVGLARGNCSFEQLIAEQCAFAAESTSTTAKPERIRLANQPAGTYTLVVLNFGPEDESIAYQVVFTPGTAAASASQDASEARVRKAATLLRGTVKVK